MGKEREVGEKWGKFQLKQSRGQSAGEAKRQLVEETFTREQEFVYALSISFR